mmetsp:Transcript_99148/g.300953  ORF Transcript_99148/g.300953 Transcript_99148/m.300953 type:complete len:723 (-) Transcript_99148:137-2305(-)
MAAEGGGGAPGGGLDSAEIWGEDDILTDELKRAGNEEIQQRIRLLENDVRVMKSEQQRLHHEMKTIEEKTKDNKEKIKLNRQLPHLVANVAEILELEPDEDDEDGATQDIDMMRNGKSLVVKTTTRQTIFLPVIGLVEAEDLRPNDLVGVNKDSYLVLDKLPAEYDSRVKAMEVDERPTDQYSDIGGLDKQIQELIEAIVLPMTHKERFETIGISPPKGVLMHGPPGTGKTLLARSLAEELRCPVELLAATDLIGTGTGESEERIRATFERCRRLAESRGTGTLLFIDEIDAICPKRDDSTEAERRMVAALLTALDGAQSSDGIVVLGATNRPDAIDPALRRSGRLEREIEVGVPNTEERQQILEVHLAGLRHVLSAADRRELARRCHGYVGADLRSLCTTAARAALRAGRDAIDLDSCLDALPLVPPSALKELLVEVPEVHWSDIGGYEGTKEALREAVEWPVRHAWAFEAMRIDPPRGVLLYGPPGCSKTMMAKAVATETEMNFVSIKGPELFSKYVGDSEKAVRDVFRKARTAAPCVVFFDEVDAVGSKREGEDAGGVSARVLAQLLAEMDGVSATGARRHVVVLAATNRPHVLDPALLRPGRFDRLVHVPLPDEAARAEIFRGQLARMCVAEGLDVAALAARTAGCSGAEVVMVCREASLLAIRETLEESTGSSCEASSSWPRAQQAHFEHALLAVRPRVDAQTVRFYEEFEQRMRQA